MSGQIFISYRRDDASYPAGRLYDRLSTHFPQNQIFMDVDSLDLGIDFVKAIEESVASCDVLVAVIGRRWLVSANKEGRRRLDNPEDFVRLEIATALKRDIRVIPVLVEGALMPQSGQLPDDLKPLARRNALNVSHDRFRVDSERLIDAIQRALEAAQAEGQRKPERRKRGEAERRVPRKPSRLLVVIGGAIAVFLLGFGLLFKPPRPSPTAVQPAELVTPPSNGPTSVINIAGNWRDLNYPSNRSRVTQEGNSFQFSAWGAVQGIPFRSSGNGTITGQNVTCKYTANYQTGEVSYGNCSGTASADGSHMTLTCTDSKLGTFVQWSVRE
jgi:hypothetical protein